MSDDTSAQASAKPKRRGVLLAIGMAINGVAASLIAWPLVRYLFGAAATRTTPSERAWVAIGALVDFPEGHTRLATFRNAAPDVANGATDDASCWVRRIAGEELQVFAINCAHLGCPVRWFPQSGLFLCPCHGGAYYQDGSRAAGPPPRGLYEYEHKIESGKLWIRAGWLPTLSETACRSAHRGSSCG